MIGLQGVAPSASFFFILVKSVVEITYTNPWALKGFE